MKLSTLLVLILGFPVQTARASELPSQPPALVVPANLPDPSSLPAATQKAVAESFEEVRRQIAQAQPKTAAPVLPANLPIPPSPLPAAPSFSKETLAKVEESFSPFYLRNGNMGSLVEVGSGFGGMETVQLAEKLSAEATAPKAAAEAPAVLAAETQQSIKNRFAGLAEDPLDPHSVLGQVIEDSKRMGSGQGQTEGDSLFQMVHKRYSAHSLELNVQVRVAGQP